LSLNADTIMALLGVPVDVLHTDTVSKSAAQSVLLLRCSNHSLSGESAKRPSSRAHKRFGGQAVKQHTATTTVSLYIVVTTASKVAACA
jgi:hypothetical protein